jgi:hypothetical protein
VLRSTTPGGAEGAPGKYLAVAHAIQGRPAPIQLVAEGMSVAQIPDSTKENSIAKLATLAVARKARHANGPAKSPAPATQVIR